MKIIGLEQIKDLLPTIDVVSAMESAFVSYSEGRAVVPPVGELLLEKGEVHIKYGYIREEEFYVIKVASGFYGNSALGLPNGNGMMLLFKQDTGEPSAILLDEGHLTDIRTAAAGAVAAKYLAPQKVERIGILGTGVQARLQLLHLKDVVVCSRVTVWGRNKGSLDRYASDMEESGFEITTTQSTASLAAECDLIVATTPSKTPLIDAGNLREGTHITAIGSDTPEKQELDSRILAEADLVVADSLSQCRERGEIHQAIKSGDLDASSIVELGDVISGKRPSRENDSQTTVVDLTGVAVQDIRIAEAVFRASGE